MASLVTKLSGVVSIFAILFALYLNKKPVDLHAEIPNILDSLRRAEKKVEISSATKIAIGFGGCLDYFVDATSLLNAVGMIPPSQSKHHNSLASAKDLSESFAYFFKHGAASERYMSNFTLFNDLVKTARGLKDFRVALGGNAPVMANRFAMEGADVLLAAQASPDFKKELNPKLKIAGGAVESSDIHLIMEYKTGEKWGEYKSVRANRYIVHSDVFNPTVQSLEPFVEAYRTFKPSLLVVGGLQMLDNFPFKKLQREARLSALQSLMIDATQQNILTHFELASFVEEALVEELMKKVIPYSDSLGMNEQELPNLLSFLKYGNITMVSDAYPRVATVLDQMRETYRILGQKHGRVSRIHVHTLAFQAIMTKKSSAWKNTMSAAAHASLTANRHICGTEMVDIETSKLLLDESFSTTVNRAEADRIPFKPLRPVSCWMEDITGNGEEVQFCIAPNLVCTKVFQTAGGGDNISSAGLVYQV